MRQKSGSFAGLDNTTERVGQKPCAIIGAPESVSIEDINALRRACEERRASVTARRSDDLFDMTDFSRECAGKTHLFLIIDGQSIYEEKMLAAALAADVGNISLICLCNVEVLERYKGVAAKGLVKLVAVQSQVEHPKIAQILGTRVNSTLVMKGNLSDVSAIARAIPFIPQ